MTSSNTRSFALALLCLLGVLAVLFHKSLDPRMVVFSNDGPLGAMSQASARMPSAFTGMWQDLNVFGNNGGAATPCITQGLMWMLGPLAFSKFYPPITLIILGLGAWFYFWRLGLSPLPCLLGALAAMLNSAFFSTSCWGVGPQTICVGLVFFALGLVSSPPARWAWLRFVVAGFAIGMAVTEGADVGALYSVFFALYLLYAALVSPGPMLGKLARAVGNLALIVIFALLIATQMLSVLYGTAIKGVAGTQQGAAAKAQYWDFDNATQWSLPKREAIALVVPGLFGFRMTPPPSDGSDYWGAVGRDPSWEGYFAKGGEGAPPGGPLRFSGGGGYEGVLVALVALWAALQSLRKDKSVFTSPQRKLIWFWIAAAILALLLAFGRHAPFYRFVYALPYASAVRNPAKFVGILNWSLLMLFGYGLLGLSTRFLEIPGRDSPASLREYLRKWWAKAGQFDRRWVIGLAMAAGAAALGCLIYGSYQGNVEQYLQTVGFDESRAHAIASFSLRQAAWFVSLLILSAGSLILVISGYFAGRRVKWAQTGLILLLLLDLGRADAPWIFYWDYTQKYQNNPVLEKLADKPFEHRVACMPPWLSYVFKLPKELNEAEQFFDNFYKIEWAQHHFLYYNIQSLDIIQMPRMPQDLATFEQVMQNCTMVGLSCNRDALSKGQAPTNSLPTRSWQLTNTRYILGSAGCLDLLNAGLGGDKHQFRILERFSLVPKPGLTTITKYEELTATPAENGNYAIFEFLGALPRAGLYSNWLVQTNDETTLQMLCSGSFDPERTVLLDSPLTNSATAQATSGGPGAVTFVSYAPKDIVLQAQAAAPSVLLLNDKYDPNWKVTVDGQSAPLLRCNYIMRGVLLASGPHRVEFRFEPPVNTLYVSMAAVGLAVLSVGCLVFAYRAKAPATENVRAEIATKRA